MDTATNELGISSDLLEQAIIILKKGLDEQKKSFMTDTLSIQVRLTTIKIPVKDQRFPINFKLPHSHLHKSAEVCFFVSDNRAYGTDRSAIEEHAYKYKDALAAGGITQVTEVMPLIKLRIEYRENENLKKLSQAFDLFVGESVIMRILMNRLGSNFLRQNRKVPVKIDARGYLKDFSKLPDEMNKVLRKSTCWLSHKGCCSCFKIGHSSMDDAMLIENIEAVLKQLPVLLPGGKDNILSINIRYTSGGTGAPVYLNTEPDPDSVVIEPRELVQEYDEPDFEELTTLDGEVVLRPNGTLEVKKTGGFAERIISGRTKAISKRKSAPSTKKTKRTKKANLEA